MIDINIIRTNPKLVKENLKKKNQAEKVASIDILLKLDEEWRSLKQEIDKLRHLRNNISLEINTLMKQKKTV